MITLITYPETFGEFAGSPFCTKAAYLLEMSGQPWQREDTFDPRPFKYGKLPAIRTASGELICDSENIGSHLANLGATFDTSLSAAQRVVANAFVRMAEEHMYFHLVLDRWGNDAVWAVLQQAYFSAIPKWVRGFVTNKMRKELMRGMRAQGLGRFTPAERLTRLEPDLTAISTLLEDKAFLFGDAPCTADASVVSMLSAIRASPVPTDQSERIAGDSGLMGYIERMEKAVPIK